jgi:hypothetical protein
MKRQLIAIALGSLFAVPALANSEIDAGQGSHATFVADNAGWVYVNAEQGYVPQTTQAAGKSREQVRAEVERARRAGEFIVNAELGTTASQL